MVRTISSVSEFRALGRFSVMMPVWPLTSVNTRSLIRCTQAVSESKGKATAIEGAALIEDFFTEEYALNHLIHHYPKPYIALMDGVVMGGGMGIAQAGPAARIRIVTERTKMAMPEVGIGLFPDVGGGHFLSRAEGQLGTYLGVTGEMIGASDALYAGLADVFVPAAELPALQALVIASSAGSLREDITRFAAPFASQADPANSRLAGLRESIEQHFSGHSGATCH